MAPVIAAVVCLSFRVPYLVATALFYFVPAALIAVRSRLPWHGANVLIFALTLALPYAIVVEWIGIGAGL
jgi:hypothetical protein